MLDLEWVLIIMAFSDLEVASSIDCILANWNLSLCYVGVFWGLDQDSDDSAHVMVVVFPPFYIHQFYIFVKKQ